MLFALSLSRVPAQTSQQDKLADLTRQIEALKQAADELREATPTNAPESAATPAAPATAVATNRATDPISRIREEGLEHSQVMQTLSHLTEAIGPRLTGSPNMKRANEWTRDTLAGWGLANAKLEPWGPFGRGWSVTRFSAQIVEPSAFPLVAYPKAWSPGLDRPIVAEVVYLDARNRGGPGKISRQTARRSRPDGGAARSQSAVRTAVAAHERHRTAPSGEHQ